MARRFEARMAAVAGLAAMALSTGEATFDGARAAGPEAPVLLAAAPSPERASPAREASPETAPQPGPVPAPAPRQTPGSAPDLAPGLAPDLAPGAALGSAPGSATPGYAIAPRPACEGRIGTARTVVLDTTGGPHFGRVNGYAAADFLGPKEVMLTFDDGPNPRATGRILDILKEHCAKATFFVVGQMARWHQGLLRRMADEGHTIAGHTERHPMPFSALSQAAGEAEIDRGFASVTKALGRPPAALFRFPGLDDSPSFLNYLSRHDVTTLSVDVIGGDTRSGATAASVTRNILQGAERRGGGILLLHDPLRRTAAALPAILDGLAERGFSLVHLRTAERYAPPAPGGGDALSVAAAPTAQQSRPDRAPPPSAQGAAPSATLIGLTRTPPRRPMALPVRAKPAFATFTPPAIPAIY